MSRSLKKIKGKMGFFRYCYESLLKGDMSYSLKYEKKVAVRRKCEKKKKKKKKEGSVFLVDDN